MGSQPVRDPLSEAWVGVPLTNPVSGERIEILGFGRDDAGRFARARMTLQPGATGPPSHVHPGQRESFTVESGELSLTVGGEHRALKVGERATVPPGVSHRFRNPSDAPVVFVGEARPPSRIVHVLTTLFGLAHDGRVRTDGSPHFLQAMVFARDMKRELYLASPPYPVQRMLWSVFAPIGLLIGYQATYDRYLRPQFWRERSRATDRSPPPRQTE